MVHSYIQLCLCTWIFLRHTVFATAIVSSGSSHTNDPFQNHQHDENGSLSANGRARWLQDSSSPSPSLVFPTSQSPSPAPTTSFPTFSPTASIGRCSGTPLEFARFLAVRVEQFSLDETADLLLLEGLLVDVYNAVASCEQEGTFRIADSSRGIEEYAPGSNSSPERELVFRLEGSCEGCRPEESGLFFESDPIPIDPGQQCYCPPPSEDTFFRVLAQLLAEDATTSLELVAVEDLGLLQESNLICDALTAPNESTEGSAAFVELPEVFVSLLAVRLDFSSLSPSRLTAAVQDSFAALAAYTNSTCDPWSRQIIDVAFEGLGGIGRRRNLRQLPPSELSRELQEEEEEAIEFTTGFEVLLEIEATCNGCGGRLFGNAPPSATDASKCVCPLQSGNRGVPLPALKEHLVETSASVIRKIYDIFEVEAVDCPSEVITFTSLVLVEYNVRPGSVGPPSPVEIETLQNGYVAAYNSAARQYCDPFVRRLESARVVEASEPSPFGEGETFTVELEVVGTCRGCNPDTAFLYDPSAAGAGNTRRNLEEQVSFDHVRENGRELQQETDICYCAVDAVSNTGPSEPDVIAAYSSLVESLDLPTVESIGGCEAFTRFETAIVFEVVMNGQNASDAELDVFGQGFVDTYNGITTGNNVCDRQGRSLSEFTVEEDVALNEDFAGRRLSRVSVQRRQQAVSPAPTLDLALNASQAPSASPTGLFLGDSDLLLVVEGTCRGCSNEFALFDQVIDARRLQALPNNFGNETDREPEAGCFCPLDSVRANPTTTSVLDAFQETVEELIASGNLTFVEEVLQIEEVAILECPPDVLTFTSLVLVEYNLRPNVTDAPDFNEIEILENGYVAAFNLVSQQFCDPFYRRLVSARVVDAPEVVPFGTDTTITVELEVVGTCRGCDPSTIFLYETDPLAPVTNTLSDPETARRNLEELLSLDLTRSRQRELQQESEETCFCEASSIQDEGPSEVDVIAAYSALVISLDLPTVESIGDCEAFTRFESAILFEVVTNTQNASDSELDIFGQGFVDTYNSITTGENVCDRQGRSLSNFAVDGDVTPNDEITENTGLAGTAGGRRLSRVTVQRLRRQQEVSPAFNSSDAPSASPSGLFSQDSNLLVVVEGTCRGCTNDFALFDQTIDSRRLQDETTNGLAGDPEASCFCPLDSEPAIPTTTSVFDAFQETVDELIANGTLTFVEEVLQIEEVAVVECEVETSEFVSSAVIDFVGISDDVTDATIEDIRVTFNSTYNQLAQDFCDPFFRRTLDVGEVQVETVGSVNDNGLERIRFTLSVLGQCRGCGDSDPLFSSENPLDSTFQRRLQELDQCFCSEGNRGDQAATGEQFLEVFQEEWLALLNSLRRQLQATNGLFPVYVGNEVPVTPSPTSAGTRTASGSPSFSPSLAPTNPGTASESPSLNPSHSPSLDPSQSPSATPSLSLRPTLRDETPAPSNTPSTTAPSSSPSNRPSNLPSIEPSLLPSFSPSLLPSSSPSIKQSAVPSLVPTEAPSLSPSVTPTDLPSLFPTDLPSLFPTDLPSLFPTDLPSLFPTDLPSLFPTTSPSAPPSIVPTISPSILPTASPSIDPSASPTISSSSEPSESPTPAPSSSPTPLPSEFPTRSPSAGPTDSPTGAPTGACITGNEATVQAFCDAAGDCCQGTDACRWGNSINSICRGSCQGTNACNWQSGTSGILILQNSCVGNNACGQWTQGSHIIQANSCTAAGACQAWTGSSNFVGQTSCTGVNSCENFPASGIFISSGSCDGDEACRGLGSLASSISISAAACVGNNACQQLGKNAALVNVGTGSCDQQNSCQNIGRETVGGSVIIGDFSCAAISGCTGIARDNTASISITVSANTCDDGVSGTCQFILATAQLAAGSTVSVGSCTSSQCANCASAADVSCSSVTALSVSISPALCFVGASAGQECLNIASGTTVCTGAGCPP